MTYQEFLSRVQQQGGLSSEEAGRAVTATLETLRACLAEGGIDALPQEVQQLMPAELMGASAQGGSASGGNQGANPQLAGETRPESGGESTAESGQ